MTELQRRIARARLLRREGKTYAEIRAVVGEVSDDRLATWLAGIPRPPQTRRTHKLVAERREARRLRTGGATYDEISAQLGVSKASLSHWLRDLAVPERVRRRRAEHLTRIRGTGGAAIRRDAGARMRERQQTAQTGIDVVTARELFFVGLAIYWSEGAKDKPWARYGRVKLTNSDAHLLGVFLSWLDLLGIAEAERTYTLNIHQTADVVAHERWWQEELGLLAASFRAPVLKRHNPKPARFNRGEHYHGCLIVEVRRSAALYDAIAGWWAGLAGAVERGAAAPGDAMFGSTLPGSFNRQDPRFWSERSRFESSPGSPEPWMPRRWWDRPTEIPLTDPAGHPAETA